ncbi:MAG: KH domain-containing protein [Clostridia bacterium]|nr:KH domain-containing protein [Clostridia bacterium]
MKEILNMFIISLVDEKDKVTIEEISNEKNVTFNVAVAENDIGKVIGRQGKIAKSIRTVIRAVAVKEGKRVNIEFNA